MPNLSNVPLLLYLVAIPLISVGTTGGLPPLTWLGFLALLSAAFITPALRFIGNVKDTPAAQYDKSEDEPK